MKTIWKYVLSKTSLINIEMPKGAIFRSVDQQYNDICLWMEIETDNAIETRQFAVYGTGHEIPGRRKQNYLGSVILHEGSLVFHVYEVR